MLKMISDRHTSCLMRVSNLDLRHLSRKKIAVTVMLRKNKLESYNLYHSSM